MCAFEILRVNSWLKCTHIIIVSDIKDFVICDVFCPCVNLTAFLASGYHALLSFFARSQLIERNDLESWQNSGKQTNKRIFMMEGLWPCASFVLCSLTMHGLQDNCNASVGCMSTHHILLYFARFCAGQPPKGPTKTYNKELCQVS